MFASGVSPIMRMPSSSRFSRSTTMVRIVCMPTDMAPYLERVRVRVRVRVKVRVRVRTWRRT